MKLFFALIILILLNNCSFDNKSGVWKNTNDAFNDSENQIFKDFKRISSEIEIFDKIIEIDNKFKFSIDDPQNNKSWKDVFYSLSNNTKNFRYKNANQLIFKSKKTTRHQIQDRILFENNNLILSDVKGNIIIFSIEDNKIISQFNFYKKQFKKIKKFLNFTVDNNIIYISDNIGYIYAYNYITDQVIWAKKHQVPFRSNLKLFSNKIITSNQNNDLFIFDKLNGNLLKLIPSEETIINNSFENNIALNDANIYFLNTFGSLYSINQNNYKFNWFVNLNNSVDLNLSNLFSGSQIVLYEDKILLSSNDNFYIIENSSGSIISKKNFSSSFKPIINNKYIFLITRNNFLIVMQLKDGKIIYSYKISDKVAEHLGTKKGKLDIKNFMIVNSNIYVFLKNSRIIQFDIKGSVKDIKKLPSSLNIHPIFIDNYLIYLNKKNKIIIVN